MPSPSSSLIKTCSRLAAGFSIALACLAPALAPAATVTFTGADTTDPNSLIRAGNYSTGALPASGDTILFNGTSGINSILTHNYAGGIAAYGSPNGVNYNVAAGQSGSLTIRGSGLSLLLLGTSALTVAPGAGPTTFDVSDAGGPLQLGLVGVNKSTAAFTNNSSNPVTFNNSTFRENDGNEHTIQFAGSGDFVLNAVVSGTLLSVSHAGTGLVTMSRASNYGRGTTIGVAQSASVLRATATQALGTGNVSIEGGAGTSRLELTGGISLNNSVMLSQRTNASASIENLSGNNALVGVSLLDGGNVATIQSDAGNLTISNVSNPAGQVTTNKTLVLRGAGNGSITGRIVNQIAVNKAGTGTWKFSGANNFYTGTTVSGGVLEIDANGALGFGNTNVLSTATSLTIDAGVTMLSYTGAQSTLILAGGGLPGVADAGYIDLTSGANITVYGLMLGTTTEPVGVYSAALFPDYIRGLGTITVSTVVPEPGTWALLAAGLAGLFGGVVRRRRRAEA